MPRFHAQFYNSLIINAPGNEAWPHPDSHYIRTDFKTGYDVLGDTSLVLSVKYSPATTVPYLKGLSICFFIISICISNTPIIYEIIRYEIFRKIFTKIFVIINRRLSKLNKYPGQPHQILASFLDASSLNVTSSIQCRLFSIVQCPRANIL